MATKDPPVRVLLVDGDAGSRQRTGDLFSGIAGLHCTLDNATDYDAGLRDMVAGTHDLYLLDAAIGNRTGIDLLREAKAHDFRRPTIVLDGDPEPGADTEALEAGAADYLEKKRLDSRLLERAIRFALHRARHDAALELEIAEHAAEIERIAASQRSGGKRNEEFFSVLAHELRNPLTAIRNAVHLLRRSETKDDLVRSACDVLERQLGQMVRLVEDLFDVSRIGRGAVELRRERIELAPALGPAIESGRVLAESMGHTLLSSVPEEPMYVDADPARIAQVLGHLLSNACKFTPRGGRISVSVEREGEQALIRVKDSGRGLAASQAARIFDAFVQVDASSERPGGGLGIGLTLVKELVEMQGGSVEARSAGAGRGSEFLVRLPLLPGAAEAVQPAEPAREVAAAARRILIVDDNRDAASSLAMLLGLVGNETHVAHDGVEAVASASRLRPDVVLLDIGLPGMSGYDAARCIRGESWGEPMLLLALTGWDNEDVGSKSRDAGFDGHLVKPVDLDALMRHLAGTKPQAQPPA
jgi:signal transduction histidine kinase